MKNKLKIKNFEKRLRNIFERQKGKVFVKYDIPWSDLTSIKIGKASPVIVEVGEIQSLTEILRFITSEPEYDGIPFLPVGRGSNIIGSDILVPFLVVKMLFGENGDILIKENYVSVNAWVPLYKLACYCAVKGLGDLTCIADIPGTVGGAIRMNAGSPKTTISRYLHKIYGVTFTGEKWNAYAKNLKWGYRFVNIPANIIITKADFVLDFVSPSDMERKIKESLMKKRMRFPKYPNAGSVFKNPSSEVSAGKLIDECGCKGMKRGGVMVSNEHANIFINTGKAKEQDFIDLFNDVRDRVFNTCGIVLEPEVKFVKDYLEKMYG